MIPDLPNLTGWTIYAQSVVDVEGTTYFLTKNESDNSRRLGVLGDVAGFEGALDGESEALLCPLSPTNANALRARLDRLRRSGHPADMKGRDPLEPVPPTSVRQPVTTEYQQYQGVGASASYHSVEVENTVIPILLIEMQQDFRIGTGGKATSLAL